MLKRFIVGVLVLVISFLSVNFLASNSVVYASASGTQACNSLDVLNPSLGCGNNTTDTPGKNSVNTMIKKVITTLSIVAGIVTVFMVILAGFQFVTSGGDSNRVSKARTALIYSMIGLLVVALSQFLVIFVLSNVGA